MIKDSATEADWALYDRVRRLTVHDDQRGGYLPAMVGTYDNCGYARCLGCPAPEDSDPWPVDAGNCAAVGESCDICGASLHEVALATSAQQLQPA